MNKKVSTLLTLGLVLGGSLLSSSAFAQTGKFIGEAVTAETFKDGDTYFLNVNNMVLGMADLNDENKTNIIGHQGLESTGQGNGLSDIYEEADNYMWTVNLEAREIAGGELKWFYVFTNKSTGKQLLFNSENNSFVTDYSSLSEDDLKRNNFKFSGYNKYAANSALYLSESGNSISFSVNPTITTSSNSQIVVFHKVKSTDIDDDDLNALYNKKGFSFDLDSVVNDVKRDIENIFNQRLVALDVKTDVVANDQVDGGKWGFPAGTYFTIERPNGGYPADGSNSEKYEYLKACKFIVVSSAECVEVTAGDRANGKGFKLVEKTGEELYKYMGSAKEQKPAGKNNISVYNACFDVTYNGAKDYEFAISLNKVYFLADEDATGEDAIHTDKPLALNVIEHAKSYYLTTDAPADNYLFKFGESGLVNALSLLENKAAAVYNIKFVSGANDKTEQNKYLTVGRSGSAWEFVAKGEALAKDVLATPAYQFLITDIDTDTNEVTFTNRESGTSFTTKLFNEGDNYSLAVKSGSDADFEVANINNSTYSVSLVKEGNGQVKKFKFNDASIVLEKSTVDSKAGFWNVEDGTMVTMAFSRDINNTSNKLYAYADDDKALENSNSVANLTSELYDATQWKLEKVTGAKSIINVKRDYVYNDNGKEAVEPFGDVISIQKYKLRYVKDAEEQSEYWKYVSTEKAPELATSGVTEYIIRANFDGSVDILTANSVDENVETSGSKGGFNIASEGVAISVKDNKIPTYKYDFDMTYKVEEQASEVRTYLLTDAPYKSWEDAGHVTIQSEVGNFLSMNDDRDAIMVDNEGSAYYLHKAEESTIAPSFFISKGTGNDNGERLFLFNTVDSIGYQMDKPYDPKYQWSEGMNKLIFKTGILNETCDTLALTVKGEVSKLVADKSNNAQNVWGGLNRFKWQIIETEDGDGYYYIRQKDNGIVGDKRYLGSISEKVTWTDKKTAIKFRVAETDAPTSNETVAASEVKVIAQDGAIVVKNAAGKNVVVSTILGQVVANEVLTSDNATINVPAGIVVVSVDGESFKINVR